MRTAYVAIAFAVMTAFAGPQLARAQAPEKSSDHANGGWQFELAGGKAYSASWFSREPGEKIESTIRRVITPVKVGGVDRVEVYTDIEVRRNKETIQRSSEKRVFNGSDMRPLSSRIDVELYAGAAVQTAWRELRYDPQRVQGETVDPKGAKRQIDKELPAGALIVPGIAFAFLQDSLVVPGNTLTFNTYNEDTDGVEDAHLKILKREKVTVAGTQHDAWKVEIKTGRTTATAHYTTTVPRILLRLKDNLQFQELIEILN